MTAPQPNQLPPTDEAVEQTLHMLRAEMSEITQQTHELTMHHAAAMVEIGALRRILVELHQRLCIYAQSGNEDCLELLALIEHGWGDLKQQREQLTPSVILPEG